MSATRRGPSPVGPECNYPTPPWATRAIIPTVLRAWRGRGTIFDAGAGEGAILQAFADIGVQRWQLGGVELRPDAAAQCTAAGFAVSPGDFLVEPWPDAASCYADVRVVVMNPPYGGRNNTAQRFVVVAYERLQALARADVESGHRADDAARHLFALLRANWLLDGEDTHGRGTWQREGRTPDVHGLTTRPKFTTNSKGKLGTDACAYCWAHWTIGPDANIWHGTYKLLSLEPTVVADAISAALHLYVPPTSTRQIGLTFE